MIRGESIKEKDTIMRPEVNYRALAALNVSMIKLFDSDPVKFFEQFKLGKKKKDSKTTALIMGDIVDFYLLDCKGDEDEFNNRFEEKFALYEQTKVTGQVLILADTLFEVMQSYLNDDNQVMVSFDTLFTEAFEKVKEQKKYKGKTETFALQDFNDNAYDYYMMLTENLGKIVVDVSLLDKCKKIVKSLKDDPFTEDVFEEHQDEEYFPKFPVEWTYRTEAGKEIACKSEVDIMKIDHGNKKIYLKDLKTTYDNENFEYSYIKHGYYLQAAFYYLAVTKWKDSEGMSDYSVAPMEFIVGDTSANNRRPIRYQTTLHDLNMALKGFRLNGVEHKGLLTLIEEISWAEDTNNWNASKNVIDNNGKLELALNYD